MEADTYFIKQVVHLVFAKGLEVRIVPSDFDQVQKAVESHQVLRLCVQILETLKVVVSIGHGLGGNAYDRVDELALGSKVGELRDKLWQLVPRLRQMIRLLLLLLRHLLFTSRIN